MSCELQAASCELQVDFLPVENCELMHFASCILRVENILTYRSNPSYISVVILIFKSIRGQIWPNFELI